MATKRPSENPFLSAAAARRPRKESAAPTKPRGPSPEEVWSAWKERLPREVVSTLRRGATNFQLRQREVSCGVQLPHGVHDFWGVHDGQATKSIELGVLGSSCVLLPLGSWTRLLDTFMEDAGLLEKPEKCGEPWEWWAARGHKDGLPWQWRAGRQLEQGGNAVFPGTKAVPADHPKVNWEEHTAGGFIAARQGGVEGVVFLLDRPGLNGGSNHVSFRVSGRPGYYLHGAGKSLSIERYGIRYKDQKAFRSSASFVWHRNPAGGGAFEHAAQRGKWISVGQDGMLCLADERPRWLDICTQCSCGRR
eukprot:Hpha_TRINITY_DN13991_c0_g3::TRINITY_DN13991_c0_g3_i2::g.35819::m.35819